MKSPFLIFLASLIPVLSAASVVSDTLTTRQGDRIIVSYSIVQQNNELSVKFLGTKVKLSDMRSKRNQDNIKPVIFERTGTYEEVSFSDMVPESFMIPAGVDYMPQKGYLFLSGQAVLKFRVSAEKEIALDIPVYLSEYLKKGKYRLIARSGNLEIKYSPAAQVTVFPDTRIDTAPALPEISPEDEDGLMILESIETINRLLEIQNSLPFSDGLQYELTKLRFMSEKSKDRAIIRAVRETLERSDVIKRELEDKAKEEQRQVALKAEEEARQQMEKEQEKLEIQAEEQKAEEEARRKRTIWMVLAGIAMSVLAVVSNQLLQHFRNIRNQKSMLEMQRSIAFQAENAAKRKARGYVTKKTRQAVSTVQKKGRSAAGELTSSIRKKTKNYSI